MTMDKEYYKKRSSSYGLGERGIPPTPTIPCAPLPWVGLPPDDQSPPPSPLAYSPAPSICLDPYLARVSINLTVDPHTAGHSVNDSMMYPATIPPVRTVTLRSPDFHWKIVVDASLYPYVTILDVLKSLHAAPYAPLTNTEAKRLVSLGIPVYNNHAQRLHNSRLDMVHSNMCRIDSLNGKWIARLTDFRADQAGLTLGVEFTFK